MTTKTRKKSASPLTVSPIEIKGAHRDIIFTDILDFQGTPEETHDALGKLQALLTHVKVELVRAKLQPLEAHVRAELEPVHKTASKLTEMLGTDQLSAEAKRQLRLHGCAPLAVLHASLVDFVRASNFALEALRQQPRQSGGHIRQNVKQAGKAWNRALTAWFRRHASDPTQEELERFKEICWVYLR